MFNGKNKALTFSYDDGVSQDIRLIGIFNKYNLKATFNINSALAGTEGFLEREGVRVEHRRIKTEDIKHVYDGHEIAAHTLTHPFLPNIEDEREVLCQVEEDRQKLSELAGYEVLGFAYPGPGTNCNDRVADIIRKGTPIKYARTVPTTQSFDICEDLYQYKGSIYHHKEWDRIFDMAEEFVNLNTDTPKVFYIWGHAYEFDIYPERWHMFDELCSMLSGRDDIFYGTNLEILGNL